jgi:hypothetical protein
MYTFINAAKENNSENEYFYFWTCVRHYCALMGPEKVFFPINVYKADIFVNKRFEI